MVPFFWGIFVHMNINVLKIQKLIRVSMFKSKDLNFGGCMFCLGQRFGYGDVKGVKLGFW